MAAHAVLSATFQREGMGASLGAANALPIMANLASSFKLAPESLADKWRVFSDKHNLREDTKIEQVTLTKFGDGVRKQMGSDQRMIASASSARRGGKLVQKQRQSVVLDDLSLLDGLSGFGVTAVSEGLASPTSGRSSGAAGSSSKMMASPRSPSGLSDFASSPDRDASLSPTMGGATSAAGTLSLGANHMQAGALSKHDHAFGVRADKRKVEQAFPGEGGGSKHFKGVGGGADEAPAVKELGDADEKSDRYMHDKISTQADALRRRCEVLGKAIVLKHGLPEPAEEDPLMLSQEKVTMVGRVCMERGATKLTPQTTMLECVWSSDAGEHTQRAKLDMHQVKGCPVSTHTHTHTHTHTQGNREGGRLVGWAEAGPPR
jgi:hypothetical protein